MPKWAKWDIRSCLVDALARRMFWPRVRDARRLSEVAHVAQPGATDRIERHRAAGSICRRVHIDCAQEGPEVHLSFEQAILECYMGDKES